MRPGARRRRQARPSPPAPRAAATGAWPPAAPPPAARSQTLALCRAARGTERPAQGQGAHARLVLQARSGHDVQHLPCRPAAPAAGVLSCAARRRLPVPGQRGLLAANDRRGAQLPPRLPECAAPRLQRRARLRGRRGARARHHEQDHPAQAHAHGSRPHRPGRHVHTHQSHGFAREALPCVSLHTRAGDSSASRGKALYEYKPGFLRRSPQPAAAQSVDEKAPVWRAWGPSETTCNRSRRAWPA